MVCLCVFVRAAAEVHEYAIDTSTSAPVCNRYIYICTCIYDADSDIGTRYVQERHGYTHTHTHTHRCVYRPVTKRVFFWTMCFESVSVSVSLSVSVSVCTDSEYVPIRDSRNRPF